MSSNFSELSADDLTIMAIFIRNSQQLPSVSEIVVQAILFLISSIITVIGVWTAMRFSLFHKNHRNIFISLLLFWFELLICRLLVWIFKYRFLYKYNADVRLLDECHHFGKCTFHKNGLDEIFIAANLRYHYMYFVISTPMAILVERIFATVLVKDYEKKPRHWIFCTIFIFQNIFSYTMAIITTTCGLNFQILITSTIIAVFSSATIYHIVEYLNSRRLTILERDHRNTRYSLSIRYQLKENLKTLKLMRRFFLSIIFFIIIMGLANSVPVILKLPENVILATRQYLDYIFHSNPIVLVTTAFLTIETYRNYIFNRTRVSLGLPPENQEMNISKYCAPQHVAESDIYFEIFEKQLYPENLLKAKGSLKKSRTFN